MAHLSKPRKWVYVQTLVSELTPRRDFCRDVRLPAGNAFSTYSAAQRSTKVGEFVGPTQWLLHSMQLNGSSTLSDLPGHCGGDYVTLVFP